MGGVPETTVNIINKNPFEIKIKNEGWYTEEYRK